MAAQATVCFVQVDPTFDIALDAINELRKARRLDTVDTVTAGNDRLRSTANNFVFKRDYDFARTLGAVLRVFMLEATGMMKYYHPKVASKNVNLTRGAGYFIDPYPPKIQLIPPVQDPEGKERTEDRKKRRLAEKGKKMRQAEEISGNFDRLYPHVLIQKKLKDAGLNNAVSFPGMMLVVEIDLRNPDQPRVITFHEIDTTVNFTKLAGNEFNCSNPSVVYTAGTVMDGEDGPAFKLLQNMIKEDPEIVRQRDPPAPQPGEQVAPVAAQAGEQAAPGAAQPEGQADPGAAKPKDEEEEEEGVTQQLEDLHLKT